MTRVWIAQCLCPQRHAIIATAGEAEGRAGAERYVVGPLKFRVASLLRAKTLNPWCGICRAQARTWRYELARTAFATMAEAMPALKENEDKQRLTAALLMTEARLALFGDEAEEISA
jgi:hypothetical protein